MIHSFFKGAVWHLKPDSSAIILTINTWKRREIADVDCVAYFFFPRINRIFIYCGKMFANGHLLKPLSEQ